LNFSSSAHSAPAIAFGGARNNPTDLRYPSLIKLLKAEATLAMNLATKLRLSVRSIRDRYAPKAANSAGPKPWERA
jgi:hypothetical protein